MIEIDPVDFLDVLALLLMKGYGDTVDFLLSLLPKDYKFSQEDLIDYEEMLDFTSVVTGKEDEVCFAKLVNFLGEEDLIG